MSSFKLRALAGACALLGASPLATAGHAQTTTISGGGSTLLASAWAETILCFDNDTANRTYLLAGIPVGVISTITTSESGCPHDKRSLIQYDAADSGAGQAGLLAHAAVIGQPSAVIFGSTDTAGLDPVYPSIQYGLSENSLVNSDLVTYDKGTSASETLAFNGNSGLFSSPASYQGLVFNSSGTTTGGASGTDYPIPKPLYGALVQFPVSVDAVALAYNPTYDGGQTFHINTGSLHLSKVAYCGIMTGTITDWNDPVLTALNNGSLTNNTPVPIVLIGRFDNSGTTSVFTRHLAAVCGSSDYTSGTLTLPFPASSLFTEEEGSAGVVDAIHETPSSIGYIGADFVTPVTGATLVAAALQNASGNFELPTTATALAAFATLSPPQSNSDGSFNASDLTTDRRDPTQWVQSTAATAPLADPTAAGAYPIVGTTNFIAYTCYANAAQLTTLKSFLVFGQQALAGDILADANLAQPPANWITAIKGTFFPGGDAASLNLFFATAGSASQNTACAASGVVGG